MKYALVVFVVFALMGCKSEKGADSGFQKTMISLSQDFVEYKKANTSGDFGTYHDTVLFKMRRLTLEKRLDTVTAIVDKIDSIGENSYEVRYFDGIFVYRALVRFRDDIDIKKSPFYQYRQTIKVGQVVDLPMYMLETSGLGINNNPLVYKVFGMKEGSIEIYMWPIPEGVTDIKARLHKDLLNTWAGNPTSFE